MNVSPVTFPSAISTWNFSNFLGTCESSCLLPHELYFVIRSSNLQTPATHRTINAMHSWVADKGLNLGHFPARGILGMFMNEVLLQFHLQLVSLYTSSDLWLSSLCFQPADFLCCGGVSRDLPSFRWHPSTQAAPLARQNLPQEISRSSRCARVPPSVQPAPDLEAMVTSC